MPETAVAEIEMRANEDADFLLRADQVIDIHKSLFSDVDTSPGPHFTVSEAAKFFFKRSSHWIRLQENSGLVKRTLPCKTCNGSGRTAQYNPDLGRNVSARCPTCLGKKVQTYRVASHRTAGGARYYDLADIEDLSQALYENGVIDEEQLRQALGIARLQGRLWTYI